NRTRRIITRPDSIGYICYICSTQKKMRKILSIAILLISIGSYGQNPANPIDSLQRVLRAAKSDSVKVNLYNKIADRYKESNPDSTRFYAAKAASLSSQINYGFGLANGYVNMGNANIIFGNYDAALKDFAKAESEYKKLLDDDQNSKALKNGLARAL